MVRGPGLPGFLAAAPALPKVLYRNDVHCGLQAVNAVLRRAGNGIAPLPLKRVAALEALGDLAARDDAEIVAAMAVHRYEFEDMARELGGRELGTPAAALSLRTHGRSRKPGHPGDYPKVYRMAAATAGQFDEDSLAQLHVNVRVDGERVEEVEEFMQVLDGVAEWFFEIEGEGDVALLSLPARHQIVSGQGWVHANGRLTRPSQSTTTARPPTAGGSTPIAATLCSVRSSGPPSGRCGTPGRPTRCWTRSAPPERCRRSSPPER